MSPSDRTNPFARQDPWPRQTAEPVHIGPSRAVAPEPAPLQPRSLSPNSIFSGSAVPVAPPPAPAPEPQSEARPSIELPPPGEPAPPLRRATFISPPRPARREPRLRRHVPLIGSLVTAAAGFAAMAFVMTRPAPELVVPPPHHPAHLAVSRTSEPAPAPEAAGPRPTLRGLMQRLAPNRRPAAATPTPPPPAVTPSAQTTASPAAAIAAPQPRPHFTPPPTPDPDAPIATRPPYS